ncbi:MAG: YdcH family protein [Pseudomonadota bacterium]
MSAVAAAFRNRMRKQQTKALAMRLDDLDAKIAHESRLSPPESVRIRRMKRLRLHLKDELMRLRADRSMA